MLDPRRSRRREFRFYGGQSVTRAKVVELAPPNRVAWDVIASFRPEWIGSKPLSDTKVLIFLRYCGERNPDGFSDTAETSQSNLTA
jgi:hypothetical protein